MSNRSLAPVSCLAACLLGSCGGESHSAPSGQATLRDFTDGQRLSGRFVATQAGETQSIGIFDRVTGVECAFQPDENARLRCLPQDDPDAVRFWQGYRDAACTDPLWYAVDRRPAPRLTTIPVERGHEVRPVEALPAAVMVFEKFEAGCMPGQTLEAGTPVLGPRVDPLTFVAGTAGPRPAPGRALTTWQIEGEDGSRFQVGLYDVAAGHPCRAVRLDGQAGLCLEDAITSATPNLFADGACTRQVVAALRGDPPASYLDGQVPRAIAGPWEGPVWQLQDDGSCQHADRYEVFSYYQAGEVLHPPRLTFVFEGQGRIEREVLHDEGGELLGATGALVEGSGAGLRDSANGGSCAPLFLPDGSFRCVSTGVARVQAGRFADPGCRLPTVSPGGFGPSGVVALLGDDRGPWGTVAGFHALGAATHMYFEGSPAGCKGPQLTKENTIPLGPAVSPPAFEVLVTNRR